MSVKPSKTILGIGGAHIDRRGQIAVDFVPGASNPGAMREDVGGGTFNALRNAVQRGVAGWMLSVRGGDTTGETVARAIAESGIRDLSVTFLDRRTPSYTALLDRHGDVIAALADMGLYDLAFGKQLRRASAREAASKVDAIFCDANLPIEALQRIPKMADGKPLFAIAISPAKAVRLSPILTQLTCLFLNTREAGALTGLSPEATAVDLARALQQLGLKQAVLSSGGNPVVSFDGAGIFTILPPVPRHIADVTGAGDALAGVAAAAILRGATFRDAVREGLAGAMLALESPDAVAAFDADAFARALALVPAARTLQEAAIGGEPHVA